MLISQWPISLEKVGIQKILSPFHTIIKHHYSALCTSVCHIFLLPRAEFQSSQFKKEYIQMLHFMIMVKPPRYSKQSNSGTYQAFWASGVFV